MSLIIDKVENGWIVTKLEDHNDIESTGDEKKYVFTSWRTVHKFLKEENGELPE